MGDKYHSDIERPDIKYPAIRIGNYWFPLGNTQESSAAMAANTISGSIIPVYRKMTFDRIAINVAGAVASSVRLGIYNVDQTLIYPTSLILDAGVVDVSGTGLKAITIAQQLDKGLYFVAMVGDGTPTLYRASYNNIFSTALGSASGEIRYNCDGFYKSQAYGALPDPFPASANLDINYAFFIGLRVLSND
jgi:hypothetical protein